MGSLYRSEEMRFCQMIVERDAAFACVAELGKKPYVQFKDLNADVNSFQRMFAKDIRRFDEMERKLRFLEAQIRKDNNTILGSVESREPVEVMPHHEINQLEGISDAAVHEIELQSAAAESEAGIALHSAEKEPTGYVVGVILTEKVNAFERILWRVCRRTAFVRHIEIEEHLEHPETVRIHKSIYSTLNNFTFDGIGKFFVAECWVPLDDVQAVREALETGVVRGSLLKPPTYNRTNKFTAVFQGIVDSYGVASYLELNPGPENNNTLNNY
uniref:V-type proton ATPase subunit a n=1 Tax=Meloidogyne hapla TaxID=6305 RepID=A0A1I8BDC3_MELHA